MTREQVLLSSAKYALEVLNMLWDDDRVVEIETARLDLDNAIKAYEVKDTSNEVK